MTRQHSKSDTEIDGGRSSATSGRGDARAPAGLEAMRLAALLKAETSCAFVYVAADEQRAEEVAQCLADLLPARDVLFFPPLDDLAQERPSAEAFGRRSRTLRRILGAAPDAIVATSPDAVLTSVPPPGTLLSFRITEGESLDLDGLRRFCDEAGYVVDERVDEPGEVAIRGAAIDIFAGGRRRPVRLELDGTAVIGLRLYDPLTQRTIEPLSEAVLDSVGGPQMASIARPCTLLDHMPGAQIVEAPDAMAARRRYIALCEEAEQEARAGGDGPPVKAGWAVPEVRSLRRLDLTEWESTPRFVESRRPGATLGAYLRQALRDGRRAVLAAPQKRDLARLERRAELAGPFKPQRVETWAEAESGQPGLFSLQARIHRGFVDFRRNLVVIAADDLFGSGGVGEDFTRVAARLEVDATQLQIGDLVVHVDHGLGRLEGLEAIAQEGDAAGEAIRLQYAKGETLLVPTPEAGRLWRYASREADVAPARLSGTAWAKRREKVVAAVAETARKLVAEMNARRTRSAPVLEAPCSDYERFTARFPFRPTRDQAAAIDDTLADLSAGQPMNRLVVGDVGFGKTEVALRAAATAALAGGAQVAVVAPTTVLARQHYDTFRRRFAGLGIEVAHLSRLVPLAEARRVRKGLKDGGVRVVVGTHALLSKAVSFERLGLLIIDEEQRFGTAHKAALRRLGESVHLLAMTATPIPRTLQSALVGLQELSVIASPPRQRRPIRTLIGEHDRPTMQRALRRERRRGGQSFVVVPRVEDIAATERELRELAPELDLRIAHGKLSAEEADAAMMDFAEGRGDVLLATSIIESGLDVPRANTMLVLAPDRFGLGQLHQLRGRVGRGHAQAYCHLLTEPGVELPEPAARRLATLAALERLGSGLAVSVQDLDHRGAGELFGERQTGHVRMIGVGLYQELLAAAIRTARNKPAPPAEVMLQIDIAGTIPETYVPEPIVRINLYHRLARVRSLAEADRLADEIADRFGPIPPDLEGPLQATRLRALARGLGVTRISAGPEGVALSFEPGLDATERFADALAGLEGADWNGERLLLREPSETAQEARQLALDLLLKLD